MSQHLQTYSIDSNNVCVLGEEGTSSNAGSNDGSMAHIEITLCQSCQRVVYLLHHVELPFRKLFESFDGTTSGPKSFSGPIGKMASGGPITNFIPIFVEGFPELTPELEKHLSSDAKYLHKICILVIAGNVSLKLIKRIIGKLCHSHWLTLVSRIVCVYNLLTC